MKLFALVTIGMLALLVLDGLLSVKREVALFREDMTRDALHLVLVLERATAAVWQAAGREAALDLLEQADAVEPAVHLRWVWLDTAATGPDAPTLPPDQLAPVLAGQPVSRQATTGAGPGFRVTYGPAITVDGRSGTVELTESLAQLHAYTRETTLRTIILAVTMGLAGLVALWIFGMRLVARPLQRLVERTRRIGAGDLTRGLDVRQHDELGTLARSLDEMCGQLQSAREALVTETRARLETLDQLRHAERLAMLGRIASGLAHELGTPLNVVGGRAALVATGDLTRDEVVGSCDVIREQVTRMAGIIRQLLDFSRRRRGERRPEDLGRLAAGVVDMLRPNARRANVELTLALPAALPPAAVDRAQIEQVLMNLVMNGIQAMPDGGEIRLDLEAIRARHPESFEAPELDYVLIRVEDQGEGIAPADLDQVFEPFFTTKQTGQGTGLGLSIVKDIVAEHDGWIEVRSRRDVGTTFRLVLPVAGATAKEQ